MIRSLRARFLLLVLVVGIVPLALMGLWLTRVAHASGEALLLERLNGIVTRVAHASGAEWTRHRSGLLTIAEHDELRAALAIGSGGTMDLPRLAVDLPEWERDIRSLVVLDGAGSAAWQLVNDAGAPLLVPRTADAEDDITALDAITASLPVYAPGSFQLAGRVEVRLREGALVPRQPAAGAVGAVIAVIDHATGASLVPLPFDPLLLDRPRFAWAGEEWLTVRRVLEEPAITLIAAAPVDPFTTPFAAAATRGAAALLLLAAAALLASLWLSGRLTHSLERLADAAGAVAAGDLSRRVPVGGADEVARLSTAFNAMTDNLRATLRRLSDREAAAAVDQFAGTLAHEVRNPLSAVRLNLQGLEEQVVADGPAHSRVRQALRDIDRLDETVAGALTVARSGRVELRPADVMLPLEAAVRSATPEFARRSAVLEVVGTEDVIPLIAGDVASLERLFLNLLLNAAQSLQPGGLARIRVTTCGTDVCVRIEDNGCGMDADALRRAWEPFYTAREGGTGLGLPVARQIVAAHGGSIELDSAPGRGTAVHVKLRSSEAVPAA